MADDLLNYDLGSDFDFDGYYVSPSSTLTAYLLNILQEAQGAAPSFTFSSAPSSPSDDKNDDGGGDVGTHKICNRPRCPHKALLFPYELSRDQQAWRIHKL